MTDRHALLIGVPECDDKTFSAIADVVRSDVRSIRSALEMSSYSVTTIGVDPEGPEPSGSRLRGAIRKAAAEVPADGVLLLYFSGHGISIDGRDYLVPSDAYREGGSAAPAPDSLIPVVPSDLDKCQARLVVFFVDACRDAPAPDAWGENPRGGVLHYPARGSFVLVAGCSPGQRCHYGQAGSVFTQTLAQVLDRRHPSRTLADVLDELTLDMRRKFGRTPERRQEPDAYPQSMLQAAASVEICDGDRLTAAWRRVAEQNRVWDRCPDADARIRSELRDLVDDCARKYADVRDVLKEKAGLVDPWFDQNYPARVVEAAAFLLGGEATLSSAEAAVLIAAPFLREVALAGGIRIAAGLEPGDFSRSYAYGDRTDLELTHEMYPQVVRRVEGLDRRDQAEARDILTVWLVHQWLNTRQAVWQSSGALQAYVDGARLLDGHLVHVSARECQNLVSLTVQAVAAEPADGHLSEKLGATHLNNGWRRLVSVLWLAGIMAADPRRMSSVIADHIGTGLELSLTTLKGSADRLRFRRCEHSTLDLELICEHPAQQAAFEELANAADATCQAINALGIDHEGMQTMPTRITHHGLRPDRPGPDESPAYETPLSRFRLSEDKVRELLMGRQLYDDPSLAIRELYQNALDACRYRDTRLEGLRRSGKTPSHWEGLITFRQDRDESGREYIECEDNGIGMSTDVLKQVFASAGERFVYRREYRAEQVRWQGLRPPLRLVPNSQFGVGVFSYFMIADEILLDTRAVGANGIPDAESHTVRIASSGSLFQITPSEELLEGGTRIRLYLTGDGEEPISVLRTMRRLLWLAEHRVRVTEHDSPPEEWRPRELRYQDESAESLKYDRDLWWVSGEGGLAADGIRTDEEIFGLIANLRDVHRPQFTVDRKKLRSWDKDWVNDKIRDSLPQLVSWPGLSISWLWKVTDSRPAVAQLIFDYLVARDLSIPVGLAWGQGASVPVRIAGCLPFDSELFGADNWFTYTPRWVSAWRAGVWASLVTSQTRIQANALTVPTKGLPIVDPIDGALLGRLQHFRNDDPVAVDDILLAIAHPDIEADILLRRLRKFAITGLNLAAIRYCPPLPRTFKKEERPLIRALGAWTPPGLPARSVPAGWLVRTSLALDQPLGEVVRRASELAPEDWKAPDIELGELTEYICTAADASLLSRYRRGSAPPWVEDDLAPAHVAESAATLGRELTQTLQMCDRFAPLGVRVAGRERYPADPTAIETDALRYVASVGYRLTMVELVLVAANAGISIGAARRGLARLERNGLLALPAVVDREESVPDGGVAPLIQNHLMDYRPWTRRFRLVRQKPCVIVAALCSGRRFSLRLRVQARHLIPFTQPDSPITYEDIIGMAARLYCSVEEARKFLADSYPEAEIPTIPEGCAHLNPFILSGVISADRWDWREGFWHLGPGEIVAAAAAWTRSIGGFLRQLSEYRSLGAPVPELTEEQLTALDDVFPDEYDEDLLADDEDMLIAERYFTKVDALTLVRISGRLGWTTRQTHDRLVRFVPLGLVLDYPETACDEETIHWQDLLLLTVHLDGQGPAIGGEVSTEHLSNAAAETGETVEWIRERLKHYSPLFTLTLAEEFDDH